MPDYTGIEQIDALLAAAGETTNRHGNLIRRAFLESGERYLFDNALDLSQWLQFDTGSDAWYFGAWVNKATLRTLNYAEGDVTYVQCVDAKSFDSEIAAMCQFYEPAAFMSTLGEDGVTRYYQDRREFFIDPERYPQDAKELPESR